MPLDCPPRHYCPEGSGFDPPFCPPGTYSPDEASGLREPTDCLPCPSGLYCRNGVIGGNCSAGYLCVSGNPVPTPGATLQCVAQYKCSDGAGSGTGVVDSTCDFLTYNSTIVCEAGGEIAPAANTSSLEDLLLTCGAIYTCEGVDRFNSSSCLNQSHLCEADKCSGITPCGRLLMCPPGTLNITTSACFHQNADCLAELPTFRPSLPACDAISVTLADVFTVTSTLELLELFDGNHTNPFDPISPYPILGGPCPTGHYCFEGAVVATPCPDGKYNANTGGTQLTDCVSCPLGFQCETGNPTPIPCPRGHYCPNPESTVPIPCPAGTYRLAVGGVTVSDCTNCPPGYACNDTGIADYSTYPCPRGHYCPERTVLAIVCPAGTLRGAPRGEMEQDCSKCPGGFYCPRRKCALESAAGNTTTVTDFENLGLSFMLYPNQTTPHNSNYGNCSQNATYLQPCICDANLTAESHIHGVPCAGGHYCPEGATEEIPCPGGHYCPTMTAEFVMCRAGYHCGPESVNETVCSYPHFCPEKTSFPLVCPGGYQAKDTSTSADFLRTSVENSCTICEQGFYSDDGLLCYECIEGYYCPRGTADPFANPCDRGHYCPPQSSLPQPCPGGTYQPDLRATNESQCLTCPEGQYNPRDGKYNLV